MSKTKQKTAAEIAAEKKINAQETIQSEEKTMAKVIQMADSKGLSKDSKVMLAYLVDKRWVGNTSLPQSFIDGANVVADALMADAIVTSIVEGSDTFAMIIRKDEQKYLAITAMLAQQGIKVPSFDALPAPTEEQLRLANLNEKPSETAIVTVSKNDVSDEAKQQKENELKIAKKAETDPTKIETQKQLHDALIALLTCATASPDQRIQRSINFYQSYLKIQANKIEKEEDKNAELERINGISRIDLLKTITEVVGDSPYVFSGIGKIYCGQTAQTGSPIAAFCLHRKSATNKDTGKVTHEDSFIADVVKTIITWTCNSVINGANETISQQNRSIEKHKDNKSHKAAAETVIRAAEGKIKDAEAILDIVNNPSFEIVDKLSENYKSGDENSDGYKSARRLIRNIMDTYHKGVDVATVEEESLLHNCAQRGGIILNMFRGPLAKNANYSEANINELSIVEKPADDAEEEKKEGESKNA